MNANVSCEKLLVGARGTQLLEQSAGVEVVCRRGRVWITQYGDHRDIVLSPGRSFVLSLPSALLSASTDAEVVLVRREPVAARGGWWARLLGLLDPRWSGRAAGTLEKHLDGARFLRG